LFGYAEIKVTVSVWTLLPAVTLALNAVTGVVMTTRALLESELARDENQTAKLEINVELPV
jgi:hypothetical protein